MQNFILTYLRILAKIQLVKIKPEIIGITGSAGKTSSAYAVRTILIDRYKTKLSEKANSETGIPLNILGLYPNDYSFLDWIRLLILSPLAILSNWEKFDKYIVEMGVDSPYEPKNMSYLLKIVSPTIGVFLNALPVHTQFFDDLVSEKELGKREKLLKELIAQEKGKLISGLPENGWAILNADDQFVKEFALKTKAHCVTFGRLGEDLILKNIEKNLSGFECNFTHNHKDYVIKINNQILSDDYAYTFLAAIAVGLCEGITVNESIQFLENDFKLPPGRMSLIPGVKKTVLIDSSYNASKFTMFEALHTLKEVKGKKKIAVLGDMRELGEETEFAHREVAKKAIESADLIITVGPLMEKYFIPELIKLGFPKDKVFFFESSNKVGKWMENKILQGEEIVLIKGSQNNIFLERVVESLMEDPQDADNLLCRRGKFWDQKRKES